MHESNDGSDPHRLTSRRHHARQIGLINRVDLHAERLPRKPVDFKSMAGPVEEHLRSNLRDLRARWHERRYKQHIRSSMRQDGDMFQAGANPPHGYGRGMSERAVEFGWASARRPRGNVLDAGSTFNHSFVLDCLLPQVERLTIVTLAPEGHSYPERGIEYLYADLRELPFPDNSFDTVMCISTLEHVGLDTEGYGVSTVVAPNPQLEALRAIRELVRVTARGGEVLLTMPYGAPHNLGWVRTFTRDDVADLLKATQPREVTSWAYRDAGDAGWQAASLDEIDGMRLKDFQANAIVCLRLKY
jgi:SAM-dependent methyltransferase